MGPKLNINPGFSLEQNAMLYTGAAFSMKFDKEPVILEVSTDYDLLQNNMEASICIDYWLLNPQVNDTCNFFLGIGTGYGIDFSLSDIRLNSIKRFVLGFNWTLYDGFLEPFVQLNLQLEGRTKNIIFSEYSINTPISVGVRFYQ